jgi:hypothetical protein
MQLFSFKKIRFRHKRKEQQVGTKASKNVNKKVDKSDWINYLLAIPEHAWLHQDRYVKNHFIDFLEDLPVKTLKKMIKDVPVIFVPSSGKYSCAINCQHYSVIMIFPELMNLLQSTAKSYYKAIMAHELGHVILQHGKNNIKVLEAQIEADRFAAKLGYINELENFLLEMPESIEKRVRLSYLTSFYFA